MASRLPKPSRLAPALACALLVACTSGEDESFNATLGTWITEDKGVFDTSLALNLDDDAECLSGALAKAQAGEDVMIYIGLDSLRLEELTDGTPFTGSAVYLRDSDIRFLYAEGVFESVDAHRATGRLELRDSFLGSAPSNSKRTFRARVCPAYVLDVPPPDDDSLAAKSAR